MRRLSLILALCGLCQLWTPAPAQAWYEWIDQLSGPGPFSGVDVLYRLKCVQDPVQQTDDVDPRGSVVRSLASFGSPKQRILPALVGTACVVDQHTNRIASLNFRIAHAWSHKNHLDYSHRTDEFDDQVKVWEFEPSFSVFVDADKFIELTSGFGWMHFRGDAFESFSRYYLRPLQATIYPGARGGNGWRGVAFTAGVMFIPKGFDATNFGARPGTFRTETDILPTVGVTFDLSRK